MPDEAEQDKKRSKISVRMGEFQVELEGTYDEIKKLMGKELFDFTRGLQETKKQLPSSTEVTPEVAPKTPEITPKAPEVVPKEKTVPPPSKPSTTSEALPQPSRVSAIGKATEKKGQRKIVSKAVVIALGLICIVLAAGLVGAIAFYYMPMVSNLESQMAERNNAISSLNSQIASLTSQVSSLASQVSSLQDSLNQSNINIATLQQAIAYYRSLLTLNESGYLFSARTLTQNANANTTVYTGALDYAGYVSVGVESNSTTTYVQVVYSTSYGVNYNNTVTVGASGAAVFPVLPSGIQIIVGNTEPADAVSATVTALYRY